MARRAGAVRGTLVVLFAVMTVATLLPPAAALLHQQRSEAALAEARGLAADMGRVLHLAESLAAASGEPAMRQRLAMLGDRLAARLAAQQAHRRGGAVAASGTTAKRDLAQSISALLPGLAAEADGATPAAALARLLRERGLPSAEAALAARLDAVEASRRLLGAAGWFVLGFSLLGVAGLYHWALRPLQRSLADSAGELDEIFAVMSQAVLITCGNGKCARANPRFSALVRDLGMRNPLGQAFAALHADLIACGALTLRPGAQPPGSAQSASPLALDGAIFETPDGRTFAISVSMRARGGAVLSFADVSSQRRQAARLLAAERAAHASATRAEELALIAQQTRDLVLMTDGAGQVTWANRAFLEGTGFGIDQVLGRSPDLQFGPLTEPETAQRIRAALSGDSPFACEVQLYRADRSAYWADVAISPIRDPAGGGRRYICTQRDISARRQIQERLAESEARAIELANRAEAASRAKSAFLASMSHEIRTPMNGVIGVTELLCATELTPQQCRYVETIRNSGEALMVILNDILDFSKVEAGQLVLDRAPFDLEVVIGEVLSLVLPRAAGKGLALQVDYAPGLPRRFAGDAGRVRQILLNLIGNAVKFTDAGEVRVAVDCTPGADGAMVQLGVADTGIGIPPDRLSQIFGDFVQVDQRASRRFQGTGLGLAISRRLARLMDGDIRAEPNAGGGTIFTVRLPLAPCPAPAAEANAEPPPAALPGPAASRRDPAAVSDAVAAVPGLSGARAGLLHQGCTLMATPQHALPCADPVTVLVAEDNATNRLVVEGMLAGTRFAPVFAEHGRRAVELFRELTPGLVLMDISMPEMDGFEATHAIRGFERARGQPPAHIVALTASAMAGDRDRCLAAGMDAHLAKPLRRSALIEVLSAATAPIAPVESRGDARHAAPGTP
ncbi:ATP-binding protein [Limibaculum sp. FT325]|uniref:hybrid sensor histidine kinase/response regulator n=1 Tax=Thermohalobaculum sediminis TaxID=2939436 RepID=UPI0020C10BB4|nr:ATP-binding protein [Limibaculum sediminis]MCL5775669.1 ATP-binding protein [Limibaculum sediminis]